MMVFNSRGRSRSRPQLIRGRGKFFRGRGSVTNREEGLRITLNNRGDSGDSGVQRSSRGRGSTHIQDRHGRDRRESPHYVGDDNRDTHETSMERKRHDHFEYRRGDVSPSKRRSHDKIDLAADAESLRITVGNEKFFKDSRASDSPRRGTPLSERLGPPVDMVEPLTGPSGTRDYGPRGRYADDGFDSKREKPYWLHEDTQRSEKYKRSDEIQLDRYKRTPDDDSQYDKARKTGSKDQDWKGSHDEYSDSCQDHQRANSRNYRDHRNMDNDDVHRRSRDRYDKEDFRHGKKKYDRYKDYDDSRRRPFSHEKRDDFNKSYESERRRGSADRFENHDHDVFANEYKHEVERTRCHSHERNNRVAGHRESESGRYSPNSEKRSPRSEREKRGSLFHQVDKELSPSRFGNVIQSQTLPVAAKPLKSILKKKSDSASVNTAGTQSGVAEQVSDFLKKFQAPLPSDNLVSMEMHFNSALRRNTNVPGFGQNEMDVDDEEKFLYGDSEFTAAINKAQQSQALFPVLDKELTKSQIIPVHNSETSANPKTTIDPSSCIPSWMKPQPSTESGGTEGKKGEDMDKTVQNILKSIGFNFDLSKRMQELAKLKKQKEEESQFSINKNASFLGGGISSADIREKLFKKESARSEVESFLKGAKEKVKHADEGYKDYAVDHHREEPKVLPHQSQNEPFRDVDLIHQPSAPVTVSQQPTPVSHFQPPPLQYSSFYSGMYPPPPPVYGHQAGHPSLVPPGNPHLHLPPTYSYASPYAQHNYTTPVSHLSQPYAPHMSPEIGPIKPKRPTGSANLTIVPIADDKKKLKEKSPEMTKRAVKREREESPEYSRIVIAPKSKSKGDRSPAQKIQKVKRERESTKDKKRNPDVEDEMSGAMSRKEKAQPSKPLVQEPKEVKLKTLSTSDKQTLLKECEDRKKKLQLLEKELGKLKKHQNEIMRRRQRQRDGHKDPLLVQNSKLQEEISIQIRQLRKASEKSAFVLKQADKEDRNSTSLAKKDMEEPSKEVTKPKSSVGIKHEFYDPGGHWCGVCHHVSASLFDYFTHLQSKKHKQKCDPYDRPWLTDVTQNADKGQDKGATVEVKAMKGVEFMMSTDAFYCSLCHIFSGDVTSAESHIKSEEHFAKYENHLQQNEFYEKRYTLEKTAFLSQVKEEQEKNGEKVKVRKGKSLQIEMDEVPHVLENLQPSKSNLDSREQEIKQEEKETPISPKHRSSCEDKVKPQKEENPGDSKQEDTTKGKIAIKLTGKTGIKPQPRILPPWTPVTKKELLRAKSKPEAVPVKKAITKTESVQPPSLDMFLTIGGPTTKKLPVYKLRSGTVKKPCSVRPKSPDEIKNQEGEKLSDTKNDTKSDMKSDTKSDMKLLGIEEDLSTPIAAKKPPPPRSQNLSLPKHPSSSSSAEELYSVFYQDSASSGRDCASAINLDDIPIPPPPPLPSEAIPDNEKPKPQDTQKPIEISDVSSDMIMESKDIAVDTEKNGNNTDVDLVETAPILAPAMDVVEHESKLDVESLNAASCQEDMKIDSIIAVVGDDEPSHEQIFLSAEVEGIPTCEKDTEKSPEIADSTDAVENLTVNENEIVSEVSVVQENVDDTLPPKESTVSEQITVSADLQKDTDIIVDQPLVSELLTEDTSEHTSCLDAEIPVVAQDFEEEMEMTTEDSTVDLIDSSDICPGEPAVVSSKATGSNTVTDVEDIGSDGSGESVHMDSDFEVLDEYEAD